MSSRLRVRPFALCTTASTPDRPCVLVFNNLLTLFSLIFAYITPVIHHSSPPTPLFATACLIVERGRARRPTVSLSSAPDGSTSSPPVGVHLETDPLNAVLVRRASFVEPPTRISPALRLVVVALDPTERVDPAVDGRGRSSLLVRPLLPTPTVCIPRIRIRDISPLVTPTLGLDHTLGPTGVPVDEPVVRADVRGRALPVPHRRNPVLVQQRTLG